MHPTSTRSPSRRRGTSLVETLVAFLVLSLGLLAATRMQTELRQGADVARQRSQALRLAQQDLERLRSFSVVASAAGRQAFADIAGGTAQIEGDPNFTLTRDVAADAALRVKQIGVQVAWAGVDGRAQRVELDTMLAGTEPALGGALSLAPAGAPVHGPLGRSVRIPLAAVDLGNGSSALVLPGDAGAAAGSLGGATVLVFDNASGTLIARCTAPASANLRLADLGPCDRTPGLLLAGHVRFAPGIAALPFGLALQLDDAAAAAPPWCGHGAAEPHGGVAFVAYHCVVHPPTGRAAWSGRLDLVAVNWRLGTGESDYRVCRSSTDLDGSGAIDDNLEHPRIYTQVKDALTHQNFSIVKGTQNCDAGDAPHQP
jgi:type IV pilus modification protein PilV